MKSKIPMAILVEMLKDTNIPLKHIAAVSGYTIPDLVVMAQALMLPPRKRGPKPKAVTNG